MKKDLPMKFSSNYFFVLKVAAMITAAAGTSCRAEDLLVCNGANQWLDAVTNFGQAIADVLNLRLARSGGAVVEFQIAK
jgi:hypothetical protein